MNCPCNSERTYGRCCQVYHSGQSLPLTAEALMRSRYTAYVLGELAYLYHTTHPKLRETKLKLAYQSTYDNIQWIGLELIASFQGRQGDKTGKVEFEAIYIQDGKKLIHHEKSRFARHQGRWQYLDGIVSDRDLK